MTTFDKPQAKTHRGRRYCCDFFLFFFEILTHCQLQIDYVYD